MDTDCCNISGISGLGWVVVTGGAGLLVFPCVWALLRYCICVTRAVPTHYMVLCDIRFSVYIQLAP